ncbi:glycoside hydrolase family 88 protein [Pseudopedobacter sp.]|uniref:glycoside hydrolase family 88/105 protein n=1 Tax=Pseudopedobacter sp. TaxID=1936787 RepID=UPI00333EA38C
MRNLIKNIGILSAAVLLAVNAFAARQNNEPKISEEIAATIMSKWTYPIENESRRIKWTYETGVFLEGIRDVWQSTAKKEYFDYVQKAMDTYIDETGNIKTYKFADYNIDNIKTGRSLLLLYRVTGKQKYFKAAAQLRKQLEEQPRTKAGSYWHKKIYPNQVWLDGLYMGMPFYTEWASMFNETKVYDDVANQFVHIEKEARDPKTGLIYHAWDESREQRWANKETGNSPHFWGRAMGWYGIAMIDVLEYFPKDHPGRKQIIDILNRFAEAVTKVQDKNSGLWYQVLDMPTRERNYEEASASSMFVYALAKGARLGYLPQKYEAVAQKGYEGIKKKFLERGADGRLHLNGTVSVAGLGGNPYRDGSYDYYMSEKVVQDDPKGIGAFLMAANEMEIRDIAQVGKGKTVMLDNYFNNEFRKNALGQTESYHYVWNELDNNGFSLWGLNFVKRGARLETLKEAPTAKNLSKAGVYIIVDPDDETETAQPNYMDAKSVNNLKSWVKKGGVLVLMANDYKHCELKRFNELPRAFGIEFKEELKNPVTGNQYEMGAIQVTDNNEIFKQSKKLYLKEISTLNIKSPARSILKHNGDVVIAATKYGKGTVFAVGDPWLYNEYIDGRKLPASFDNFKASEELAEWLLKHSSIKSKK